MQRIVSAQYSELIGYALDVLPPAIRWRLRHVEFLTGLDPRWVGLHNEADEDWDWSTVAHCAYPHHTSDQSTTIVLPVIRQPWVVVHELGHALHATIGWEHEAVPVTDYAWTDRHEAFADAFVASLFWFGVRDIFMRDEPTRALFQALSIDGYDNENLPTPYGWASISD
jgi:hypothetical protein